MDIPLPGEPDPHLTKVSTEALSVQISSPHNIPLPSPRTVQLTSRPKIEEIKNLGSSPPPLPPGSADAEDSNRYSPSRVTGDDDTCKDDQQDQESSQQHGSPLVYSSLASKGTRTTVLGKAQAKKRLLAFSMTKQGGGQGLSFGFNKKAPFKMNTGSMPFAGTSTEDDTGEHKEKEERVTSPKKKGMGKKGISRDDKARAVVSAIEEIKREEMLMRGVLGYGAQINVLADQTYPLPLMTTSFVPPAKPREELEMGNILSEQQKGAIEELLGSLLTHDSEKKSRDEEKEKRRNDEKRKKDSEKSSRHSKERHKSKESHSRSGRDREKEEKKHRPSELPKNWQQFRDRGFKFEEIRRLKLKLEKDKLASNNRERMRKSRDREHRSRSREKRHKSPNQPEEKDKSTESDYDIMSRPFESTSRLIYPFMAVGVRQMQKQYPRSLIRFTKFRPAIPYSENPATSKAYYRTREEILCEASQRVVDLMHCVINGDLSKTYVKAEKNYKIKRTSDTNLSNSLAALQVSYDETEIDENVSSSDDTSGIRRERPWFLSENLVVWADNEEVGITTSSDMELNVKRERSDETDVENFKKKKDSSVDISEVKEIEMPNFMNSEHERDMKSSESGETKHSLRTSERTTVRSKWDSDYEEDRVQEDNTIQSSHLESSQPINEVSEKWEEKENDTDFIEMNSKEEIQTENRDKSGTDSENSSDDSSESSSVNESNTEDSIPPKDNHVQKVKEAEYKQNHKNTRETDDENVQKAIKCAARGQESSANNVHPENSSDGNTNQKLASEYEEFMKAVSFESTVMDDEESEIASSEHTVKSSLKQPEAATSPLPERRERNSTDAVDSEASHDKLDIEPARIEETHELKKLSEPKLQSKPKLMTSSASEDELLPAEEEEKQEPKVRSLENSEQNNTQSRRERKHRSSSNESSSSSESSYESEEVVKEKRKSKSKKMLKKKRKKVVHSKKKLRKASKKKRVVSSSSSESDSSSNADSSSSSSSDGNKKKQKHKEKSKRRNKSSSSDGSDNDSSSDNASSDEHIVRKKKKKKKVKKAPKKKASKKRKRSRKETESSDSEENVRSRRSKTRHKNSKKDSAKENNDENFSNDEKIASYVDSNSSSHRKDSEIRLEHSKKQSGKSKGGSNEIESSQKKSSKKYSKDNSSVDESYEEEREKKNLSKKKSSGSYKKSTNYHESETSEDELERRTMKKRRRERRSCTTSPVVSSNKKRRRSPSTSPEHSPTPQRRNSTEGKSVSQRERSKEQSSSSRKLKHSSGSSKKGHKQKDLEVSEDADVFSEDHSFKRSDQRRRYRSSNIIERDDWEVNSANEDSCDSNSNSREKHNSDVLEDMFSTASPRRKSFQEDFPDQLLRSEDIKKEVFSEEENELPFINKDTVRENLEKMRNVSLKQVQSCESEEEEEEEDDDNHKVDNKNNHRYQKQSRLSYSEVSGVSNLKSFCDKYSFVQVKVEPEDELQSDSEKDVNDTRDLQLYSPDQPDEESKSHISPAQPIANREVCSTDSSQFSQIPEKVMDRYGSDISQESFKDSSEGSFTGKLFRKPNFSKLSDENIRSSCLNPETPQVLPTRGINFPLDNIQLPSLNINPEETDRFTQIEDISNRTPGIKINNSLTEKLLNLPPPELCISPSKSSKPGSQRHVISFKLSSPSHRLSSQAHVESSDNIEDGESNLSSKQHIQDVKNTNEDIFESERKIESRPDRKTGISIFESSSDEWITDRRIAEPLVSLTANISTNTSDTEVSSSSKLRIDSESCSSKTEERPKERARKRPSRWGMTTVPPKKKAMDELYESLPEAKNESSVLLPTVELKMLYDRCTPSGMERNENEAVKEIHGTSLVDSVVKKTMESLNKKIPVVSEKKVELDDKTERQKFSVWERERVDDQGESWEVSRSKDTSYRNKYTVDRWHDNHKSRDKFSSVKAEKGPEGCGPLIDWENDFEQSKSMNDDLPPAEVNLFHYSHDTDLSMNSCRVQSRLDKENISQDDSESEWETKEVNYQIKSPSLRSSDTKSDAKEKTVHERQEPRVEITSQRLLDFQSDDRSWDGKRWHSQDLSTSKWEDRRHKDEIHDSRKDDHEIMKDVRDKRKIEEGRIDGMYRDVREIDDSNTVMCNKEKGRKDESQAQHDRDDYRFREKFTDVRSEESSSKEQVIPTASYAKHTENKKLGFSVSGDHSRNNKGDDKHWKEEKENILRERRDIGDHIIVDNHEKNRKECDERIKREIGEDHEEDRVKKYSGERERDRRETDDEQRREDRNRKDYLEGERGGIRDKERRENEIRDLRHEDELVRKEYVERDRSTARDRERRETRDRRDERRRDRERDRRGDRRDRDRWERDKRDRHREERECGPRSRSPVEYHDRDRRGHREERERSHSPPADYWQGEWDRTSKDRDCDCTGNYFVRDIPLPINSTLGGSNIWPSATGEAEMELSCSPASSPLVGFKRSLADSTISDSELVACKQEEMAHRSREMSPSSSAYSSGFTPSKPYERKQSYLKHRVVVSSPSSDRPPTPTDSPAFSPKRLSLDDRIEMELGVKNTPPPSSVSQYQVYQQSQPPPQQQQPPPQQQTPLQQQLSPTQSQQPAFPFAQYYAHVPPPTQFEPRNNKFLSMPPPPYGQPIDEYAPPQHMYPPLPVKPHTTQMPPPSIDAPPQKRRPPLLPTPNIPPLTNWDSPEAFIGAQPPQSSRVVQVGNVLQVVPVEAPPASTPAQGSSQSIVLQTGNVLQVIPGDTLPNTLPPVTCGEPPPVSNASSQVVQVGNVLQVIPGPTTSTRSGTLAVVAPPKSTFPPTTTQTTTQGPAPQMPLMHLPPMHGPPANQVPSLLPSSTHRPPGHPPPTAHLPPTRLPPPHGVPTHPPPPHCPPPHTPPMRGPPVHTPPIQVPSVHGLATMVPSPSQSVPLLKSPNLEMSPSPVITSPLLSAHGSLPSPVTPVQVTTSIATSPIPSIPTSGTNVMSSVSLATSVIPPNIAPTPVAAPISYSPPASPFLVSPVVHTPMVPVGLPENTPVVATQGDCPIPFLSSVETAQVSQMEEAERRRVERARRRAEKEKRRREKEKRHQNKIKQATEMIIKKALEQEGEMLGTASDIDLEEMRLIEEAMQQVPEQEEEMPQTDEDQYLKKRKRKLSAETHPLPPAGKGILVSPGFREKPSGSGGIERKSVKFADGIRPGEGTSPSAGEDLPSPPPPPRKLPKEKRYKKKKKKKIKVKIIRQINVEDEDDDDEDISPPPPPPGSPPPPPMYPPGAHYPPTYPPGFTYSTAPPFTVLPGVDSSTGAASGTTGNLFTPLYHQHHHTTTTTHTTTVQFAPPPPPVTPVPPPPQNPHIFKRETKSNP